MQFSTDNTQLYIGLNMKIQIDVPFYSFNVESGKLDTNLFTQVLCRQCGYQIAKNEAVTSICMENNIACIGSSLGNVYIIDTKLKKELFRYNHGKDTSLVSSILITDDLRWIVSSDIDGYLHFYYVTLKEDITKASTKDSKSIKMLSLLQKAMLNGSSSN